MPTAILRVDTVDTEDAHHGEGNAYVRLGDILSRLGRKDEARDFCQKGVQQAERHGHGGMAEALRLALIQLGE